MAEDEAKILLKNVSTSENIQSTETEQSFRDSTLFKIYWPISDRGGLFRIGVSTLVNYHVDPCAEAYEPIPTKWLWEPTSRKVTYVKRGSVSVLRYYSPQNKYFKLAETFYMGLVMDEDKGALWFGNDIKNLDLVLEDFELRDMELFVKFETQGGSFENVNIMES